MSLARLGDMQAARGDRGGACAVYEEAREIVRALAACAPDSATERSDLAALDERIAAVATAE